MTFLTKLSSLFSRVRFFCRPIFSLLRIPLLPLVWIGRWLLWCGIQLRRDPGLILIVLGLLVVFFFSHLPRFAYAVPVHSLQGSADWRSHWDQLPADKNVGGVLWQVEGSFEIQEDFKSVPDGYWQIGAEQTVGWKNSLLNAPNERSDLYKLGAGRLAIHSEGNFNGVMHLLEGSLFLGSADVFTGVADSGVHAYAGSRLEYGLDVQMWGRLDLQDHPLQCGAVACPVNHAQGSYADGMQWVVGEGVASQYGAVFADVPIYKLGAGVLYLGNIDVGPGIRGPFHVLQGGVRLNTASGAPMHIHRGAWAEVIHADLAQLFIRPGGRLQVGRHNGGPGLKVGMDLVLEAGALTELHRSSAHPENPVIETRLGANVTLDGHLLIGLSGSGWDPDERYALILVDGYQGQFADYQVQGDVPEEHTGMLLYEDGGLWLGFEERADAGGEDKGGSGVALIPLLPQPRVALPYAAHRHNLLLSSHYFPQSVWQFYQSRDDRQPGLSGWAWSGGARLRSSHSEAHSRLNYQMNYLGLNWQSSHDEPINIGLQFGVEHGNWYAQQDKTHINGWVGGISLQQQHSSGWHWQLGVARHQYRLDGHRAQNYSHRHQARMNQVYGQIGYTLGQATAQANHWSLSPTLSMRWIRLRSPQHQERSAHSRQGITVRKTTDTLTELALGVRGQWTYQPQHQPTTFYTELKHHWWKGHTRLQTFYTTGHQDLPRSSSGHSHLKPYTSWQIGLNHQPSKHWNLQANMQVRVGKGLRDNAFNLQLQGAF